MVVAPVVAPVLALQLALQLATAYGRAQPQRRPRQQRRPNGYLHLSRYAQRSAVALRQRGAAGVGVAGVAGVARAGSGFEPRACLVAWLAVAQLYKMALVGRFFRSGA